MLGVQATEASQDGTLSRSFDRLPHRGPDGWHDVSAVGIKPSPAFPLGRNAIIAHVGDSRAYLFRDQALRQLTRDHTFAQTLRDVGVPAEKTEQYRHLLVNSFGARPEDVKIDVDHVPLEDGDRLLLCSDGLTDMVTDAEITSTLVEVAGAQAACDALIERALHNGGKDNVTVLVADLDVARES